MKMKLAIVALAGALIPCALILGCNGKTAANGTPPKTNTGGTAGGTGTKQSYTLADVPANLRQDAFEYFGLGNEKMMDMQVTQTGQAGVQTGTQSISIKEAKPDEVLFVIERTGGLSNLGSQTVALRADGVYLV